MPGQGSFKSCVDALNNINGLVDTLNEFAINNKKPLLGICVGLTWEIAFALAGDSFHLILVDWPIDLPLVRNINYAFLDSLIFLIGIFLCNTILKSDSYLYTFNSNALLIMIIWGSISEFLVDLNCSGKLWVFLENWYNPVFITINGNNLTILPQLIWLVAPIVYYFAVLRIFKKF